MCTSISEVYSIETVLYSCQSSSQVYISQSAEQQQQHRYFPRSKMAPVSVHSAQQNTDFNSIIKHFLTHSRQVIRVQST